MNKSQIFFTFRETSQLSNIINSIPTYPDFTNKIIAYSNTKAQQFVNYHNKYLDVRECQTYSFQPYLTRHIFVLILTRTNTNHPYLLFFNLDDIYITFVIPYGGDYKQADTSTYWNAIPECNNVELAALYILLEKTIYIRKLGIVDSKQFSLINCSNIANCVKKMHEIDKMKISANEKQELKAKYNEQYLHKAIDFLKYYFNLLETQNFNEATLFLRGGDKSHFGKQRLNTFFKNTKSIIGHLEVFISLYKLFYEIKTALFPS